MRETQKTILERAKPIFKSITQPIISAASRPWSSGVQFTVKLRREVGLPKATDGENRRLKHDHKVRLSDEEEAIFQEFLAASDMSAQDVLRGLVCGKLYLSGDGLASMIRCISAKGTVADGQR